LNRIFNYANYNSIYTQKNIDVVLPIRHLTIFNINNTQGAMLQKVGMCQLKTRLKLPENDRRNKTTLKSVP